MNVDIDNLKNKNELLTSAIEELLGEIYVPDAHCSCHLAPPCGDCVEYSALRNAIKNAEKLIRKQDQ